MIGSFFVLIGNVLTTFVGKPSGEAMYFVHLKKYVQVEQCTQYI